MKSQIEPIVLPADESSLGMLLHSLRDYVSRAGHIAGLTQRSIYKLKLAVDEVATNIVLHGYKQAPVPEPLITATVQIRRDTLSLTLEDSGAWFDPRLYKHDKQFDTPLDTRELGGLGIFFALSSVDYHEYEFVDDFNRNTFIMNRPVDVQTNILPYRLLLYGGMSTSPQALINMLQALRYRVETINQREEVIRALVTRQYDLLILGEDISHPDAIWLLKQLRLLQHPPNTSIMVAASNSSFIVRCLELGATDYIRTPVAPNFLSWRLEKILQDSNAELRNQVTKLSQHIKRILISDDPRLRFGKDFDFESYLENFLVEVQGIYNADAGTIYLRTESDSLRFALVRTESLNLMQGGTSGTEIDIPTIPLYDPQTNEENHHNVASHVALTGNTVNITDIYENEQFDFTGTRWFDKRNNYRSMSTLTVPLKDHNDSIMGVVQLINARDDYGRIVPFETSHQMLVEALCAHTAVIVNNHRLLQREDMMAQLRNDLKIGRQIQLDFMPKTIPQFDGWQIEARFFPAREVAGDFYDIFDNDGLVMLLIADICDKGVGAALFMALIRSLLRAFSSQSREYILGLPPAQRTESVFIRELKRIVETTNDYILEHHYELNMFTTLFAGLLNPNSGKMIYINGGHTPAPVVHRNGSNSIEPLKPTGPAVGMFEDAVFRVEHLHLNHGDSLVAYTDGIPDLQNTHGNKLGTDTLIDMVRSGDDSIDELTNYIEDMVLNHRGDVPQYDDVTFWVVRRDDNRIGRTNH